MTLCMLLFFNEKKLNLETNIKNYKVTTEEGNKIDIVTVAIFNNLLLR